MVVDFYSMKYIHNTLCEVTRLDMIRAAKNQSPDRFIKKNNYTTRDFKNVNFKKLMIEDEFLTVLRVGDYVVSVAFEGAFEELQDLVKSMRGPNRVQRLSLTVVQEALSRALDTEDLYVSCSCLHPDTKIKLLDGRNLTVAEMADAFNAGEKLYVYSVDENGEFKPGEVKNVWITKQTRKFIKVTLDNGESVMTTPDHLYMMRDGSYMRADELSVNQSLMPLYFSYKDNGYESVKSNVDGHYRSVYKLVADYYKHDEIENIRNSADAHDLHPYGVAIHHLNFDKNNNNPENLKPMTARAHIEYHAEVSFKRLWEDPEWCAKSRERSRQHMIELNANPTDALIASRLEWAKRGQLHNYDPDWKPIQAEIMREAITKYWRDMSPEEYEIACKRISDMLNDPVTNAKLRKSLKKVWDSYSPEEREWRRQIIIDNNNRPEVKYKQSKKRKEYWATGDPEKIAKHKEKINESRKKAVEAIKGKPMPEEQRRKIGDANRGRKRSAAEKAANSKWQRENSHKLKLSRCKRNLNELLSKGIELTPENFLRNRRVGDCHFSKLFESFEAMLKFFGLDDNYNHKIVSIETIYLEDTPVYDISVNKYHNFLTSAGVILHNCADFKYRFRYYATQKNYLFGKPIETRKPKYKKTNMDDNKGYVCKHILAVLYGKRWVPFAAKAWLSYMKSNPELTDEYLWPNKRIRNSSNANTNINSNDNSETSSNSDSKNISDSSKDIDNNTEEN